MRWPVLHVCAALCLGAFAACGGGGGSTDSAMARPPSPPASQEPAIEPPPQASPEPDEPTGPPPLASPAAPSPPASTEPLPPEVATPPEIPAGPPPQPAPQAIFPAALSKHWAGQSFSIEPLQSTSDLYAALLDAGAEVPLKLWGLEFDPVIGGVPKLIRGDVPRVTPATTFGTGLVAKDFRAETVTRSTATLRLTSRNLYVNDQPAPGQEYWETAHSEFHEPVPPAAEVAAGSWLLTIKPLVGPARLDMVIAWSPGGQTSGSDKSCSLQGNLHSLGDSDWFALEMTLSGCGLMHDGERLEGYGKLLRSATSARFIGAVLTPEGDRGFSILAKSALQPD
jgi:hypothetical protein